MLSDTNTFLHRQFADPTAEFSADGSPFLPAYARADNCTHPYPQRLADDPDP